MTEVSKDQKKRIQALNALNFLRDHPAFCSQMGDSLFDGAWIHMAKCCKRNKSEDCRRTMTLYRDEKGASKFKDRFEKEYKADSKTPKEFQSIYVSYKERYGEPWVFDHVEYWYETTFFIFTGDIYDEKATWDYKNWSRYGGPEGGALTFEDAIISQARGVKKAYGSFNTYKDFLTEAEKKNHKCNDMFLRKKDNDYICLDRNPEYLNVTDGMKNVRWLKWFMETDYCKKQWKGTDEFKDAVKKLDKIPASRKKLIKKYE
jgi:hypothetical protein